MAGQGSPKASLRQHVCQRRQKLSIVGCCALLLLLSVGSAAADPTLRVRVAWGGGAARIWHATISPAAGRLSGLVPLGIEPDEPGSAWIEGPTIYVDPSSPRSFDGVDFSITAPLDTVLSIDLTSRGRRPDVASIRIKLADLVSGEHQEKIDRRGNWLLARRAPGDQIRLRMARRSLVFSAGETFRLDVEPHLLGLPKGTNVRVTSVLRKHGSKKEVWEQEGTLASVAPDEIPKSLAVEVLLPNEEGVYDLLLTAERRSAIRLWQNVAQRTVQLIVLESRPLDRARLLGASPPTKLLQEIDPAENGWWRGFGKLPDVNKLPGLAKEPLNHGTSSILKHPTLGKMIQLGRPDAKAGISWRAYPLSVAAPGQPHVLEVEYPSDAPLKLGISLIEPNAAGEVAPIGVDSAVSQRRPLRGPAKMATHRMIVWPRTDSPLVLLTNLSETEPAYFGKIRLYGPKRIANAFRLPQSAVGFLPRMEPLGARPATSAARQRYRLLAGYYEKPLFGENFSAPEMLDEPSGRSLDDWNTFYQGGTRLVEYLNHVGYNALVLSVLADGGTIYPSDVLNPTPKYDTGLFFSNGQDPLRKDVLEMLFRLFDRNDLRLIPALQFSTPLPELEARLRSRRFGNGGIELIGGDGRPYLASHRPPSYRPRQGRAPYYNPLNPHVQEAMQRVLRELVRRYSDHPSFGGISIQLSSDGFAQLPSAAWGLDDTTFARFEADEQVNVDQRAIDRFAARAQYVNSDEGRKRWLAWRARQMRDFYRRLQRTLPPGAKLYLAGANMFDAPALRRQMAPTLPRRMKFDEALLEVGIDCRLYQAQSDVVLLRGQWNSAGETNMAQALHRAAAQSPRIDAKFAGLQVAGSLMQTVPHRTRLKSFDAKSPFGKDVTFTWLVAQPSPSGDENRRRLVHSLAAFDAQALLRGGWMLPLGQEQSTKDLMTVYRHLPAAHFDTVAGVGQPVTVRTFSDRERTYVYLLNDSAAPVQVNLTVDAPGNCRLNSLSDRRLQPLVRRGRSTSWAVKLNAYDLVGATFSAPRVQIGEVRVTVSADVEIRLEARIRALVRRVNELKHPLPLRSIANPGFETVDAEGRLAAWQVRPNSGGRLTVDGRKPHAGARSGRLSSATGETSLVSRWFAPPPAGQLWVSLWLRIDEGARQPKLRLALEGTVDERPYRRFAEFGPASRIRPVSSTWGRYDLKLDDLPKAGRGNLRLRLDMLNAGEVLIDDCQVFLVLSKDEHAMLQKTVALAHQDFRDKKFGDCARALDGYWPRFLENSLLTEPAPLAQRNPPPVRPKNKPADKAEESFLDKLVPGFLK